MLNKKRWVLLLSLFLVFPLVYGFGVNSPYWETNPLIMYPGQEKEIQLTLQNMVGDKDMTLSAEITEGKEFASILDAGNKYTIPFGIKDFPVNIKIKIPEGVKIGDTKELELTFTEVVSDSGQMVQMSGSVGTKIPILIKSPEEVISEETPEIQTPSISLIPIIVIVLIILVILIIYFGKVKKGKNSKK
ncbi:MAG: hypothetical protein PHE43_00690 [Candidatus Nanoarchaeia archaeon]|nr:hypothetical protein [Candidatus Nanoarchaeia archaeon]